MPARLSTLLVLVLVPLPAQLAPAGLARSEREPPPLFVENVGQFPAASRYVARRANLVAHAEAHGLVLQLLHRRSGQLRARVVRLEFEGAAAGLVPDAEEPQRATYHYLRGTTPGRSARTCAALRYREAWPGVDLRLRHDDGVLTYDVVLAPEARLEDVVIRCRGADDVRIDGDGSLVLSTAEGVVRQTPPVAWSEERGGAIRPVACRFRRLDAERFGFAAPDHVPGEGLVIDPGIEWSTFLGGVIYDYVNELRLDGAGLPVAAGYSVSADFPTVPGSFDPLYNGNADAVVTKLAADGRTLLWSTYLGGGAEDYANGLAVAPSGEVTVVGITKSANFPTTPGAFQRTASGGNGDGFVVRLAADGSALVFSTYLGAPDWDQASAVDVDATGNATVAGVTKSPAFPVTAGAFDTTLNGGGDGFVARLDPTGSRLLFCTFLGSSGWDPLYDVVVDARGDAFVVGDIFGVNNTSNFPTTPGAFDTTYNDTNDRSDTIVCKLSGDGRSLLWSTWLGGNNWDPGFRLLLDEEGNPVVCGESWSPDFPVTQNAFQTINHGDGDAYVARLSADGARLLFATFLGGRWEDRALDVGIDPFGAIVIAGFTERKNNTLPNDFPTTPGAFSRTFRDHADAFVARLSGDGSRLYHSTLCNGSQGDRAYAMALDRRGSAFLAGDTFGVDFPATPGAYDTTYNGGGDAFVALLDLLPLGSARFGPWTPACAPAAPIGMTVEPRENVADFAIVGAGAPPATAGALLLAAAPLPVPVPILGARLVVDFLGPMIIVPGTSDARGRSLAPLPLGGGLRGAVLSAQWLWLGTSACGGFGTLSSSNGLTVGIR